MTELSLSLETNPPTVQVKSGYSKRRRLDTLPLPSDILDQARLWLSGKKGALWPGRWAANRVAGKMLQVDLEAAGVEYVDADGLYADFHSLRHTYITNLARKGVSLATAQKLARHSTPVLTAARYTHIELSEQHKEVKKLAGLGRNLGQTGGTSWPETAPVGSEPGQGVPISKNETPREKQGFSRGDSSGEGGTLRRSICNQHCRKRLRRNTFTAEQVVVGQAWSKLVTDSHR